MELVYEQTPDTPSPGNPAEKAAPPAWLRVKDNLRNE